MIRTAEVVIAVGATVPLLSEGPQSVGAKPIRNDKQRRIQHGIYDSLRPTITQGQLAILNEPETLDVQPRICPRDSSLHVGIAGTFH